MKNRIALAALALSLLAAPSFAADRPQAGTAPKLTLSEIDARVRENGYPSVRAIELKRDGNYEVKAVDAENRRVELRVDGNTGAFLMADSGRGRGERHDRDGHGERDGHNGRDSGRHHDQRR
jgi:hypothetical protein